MVDVGLVSRTGSSDLHVVHDESYPDAVKSSENLTNSGRRHSTVDTALLLSAILAQLRYITADMRRHCKSTQVKDEWK